MSLQEFADNIAALFDPQVDLEMRYNGEYIIRIKIMEYTAQTPVKVENFLEPVAARQELSKIIPRLIFEIYEKLIKDNTGEV